MLLQYQYGSKVTPVSCPGFLALVAATGSHKLLLNRDTGIGQAITTNHHQSPTRRYHASNTAVTTAKAASEESNGRLAALQGVKAALNGAQAVQAGQLVQAQGGDAASMFGISASLGSQKSSSQQHQEQTSASGSTLTAGNNLTVTATGEGSSANSGDIVVQGSQLKAGGDTTGVRVDSKTIWKGKGQERIDVENPAPGKRAGQVHYQDNKGNKYYYDPITQSFPDAPKSVNAKLENSDFKNAVEKGMSKYLGEK
ncbi:putative adhesin/hemolysin precursor [Yersinia mollaretii]|nr:hemagglutinin repeat-containing protein [Yersinia mollaretii]CNK52728.1 putative adhesin/hemolysin precursor [Yersinia mollaretii]